MRDSLKIVGIGGSIGDFSTSLVALETALNAAAEAGAVTELIDLAELSLPMYAHIETGMSQKVIDFCEKVHQADALIFCSPLYHGSISGLFKNAIDWLELLAKKEPIYLSNKPVGLIAVAGGIQAMQAINSMEYIVRALRGWTMPFVVPINRAWQIIDKEGISDKKIESQLISLGKEMLNAAKKFQ
jgi:FMN reductase